MYEAPRPPGSGDGDDQVGLLSRQGQDPTDHLELDQAAFGEPAEAPSARQLLRARPYFSGYLHKKRDRCAGLCPCFRPKWQRRFFIISGRYLFRYHTEDGARPKGVPIPLENATFRVLEEDSRPFTFGVTTLSKELVLAAEDGEAVRGWLDHLRAAKQRAIKESLGHATELRDHHVANQAGSKLFQRKMRREAQAAMDSSGIEMRAYGGPGGGGGGGGTGDPF